MNKSPYHTRGGRTYNNNGKPRWYKKENSNSSSISTSGKHKVLNYTPDEVSRPYRAWRLYFTEESFTEGSPTHRKICSFENYIKENRQTFLFDKIEENKSFFIDLSIIVKNEKFLSDWPNFLADLNSNADHTLSCLGIAMHQMIINEMECLDEQEIDKLPVELPLIHARITNHQPIIQLRNLKVNYFGKLVSVRGTVIRVGNVKLLCRWMAFKCSHCSGIQVLRQPEGVHTLPTQCITRGCRAQSRFTPMLSSPHTRTDNWQVLKLQELVGNDQCEGGRIPRTVECELTDDLVGTSIPGDDVTVTGIIKVRNTEEGNSKNKQTSAFLLYLDVVSIVNNKNQSHTRNCATGIEFSQTDYCAIRKIHAEPFLFKLLVHSLCPTIYGHEMVKAGLLLGLFGGTARELGTREDSHILMVGDPGLGKSQMLQSCSNVTPRGVFVCGNSSTSSGLTATVTRESGATGGDFSLEAGALVLADQGCCCIDEFDKMPTQHAALLEAMEQQTISIAKAGVVCDLPARTTILAAANPAGGHYNRAKTVSENLRIGAALLSRFDLVFILRDKPDKHLDSLLSEHVLALHLGLKNKKSGSECSESTSSERDLDICLQNNLKLMQGEVIDALPHPIFRKYIAYARKYVHPHLSTEAAAVLKQFYLELRKQHQTADSTPVTARQAESLRRLTLARAKLELREEATAKDAIDVVEIMKYSLVDTFSDDFGNLDFSRSQNGSGMSQRNKVKKFVGILQRKAEVESRSVFTVTELKQVAQNAAIADDFFSLLDSLNIHGYLLKKDSDKYQLLSAN